VVNTQHGISRGRESADENGDENSQDTLHPRRLYTSLEELQVLGS
jgi:hypothetical protein